MKRSEIYKMAQIAVLESPFSGYDKLEILRELMEEEKLALFCEERKKENKDK